MTYCLPDSENRAKENIVQNKKQNISKNMFINMSMKNKFISFLWL